MRKTDGWVWSKPFVGERFLKPLGHLPLTHGTNNPSFRSPA